MNKIPDKLKKTAALFLALAFAFSASLAVYASLVYDSSIDPVVSLSGLAQYVEDYVLGPLTSRIDSLAARVSALELGGGGGGGGGMSSEAYQSIMSRITALEDAGKTKDERIAALEAALKSAADELGGRLTGVEQNYADIAKQISAINDSLTGIKSSIETLRADKNNIERNFSDLSNKYLQVTKAMNTLQASIDALTGEGGAVTELQNQYATLSETLIQLQTKAGVMYRPVFVESGKIIKAKNADEGILVIVRSGYAVIVSPYNTSGTLQGINDLTNGEELYNGADAPLMHNLLIPRGADDGRGIRIESYDGAYVMIGGEYIIVDDVSGAND